MASRKINVLIVDDHPTVGEGTKVIIEQQEDMKADVIVDSERVKDILKQEKYEIYLVDLYMPKLNGIELSKIILQIDPDAIILIYTGFDIMSHYNLLIELGVAGFISKTATQEQLITAIRCVLREEAVIPLQLLKQLRRGETGPSTNEGQQNLGDITLSNIEQQILDEVSKGLTNNAIALNLSMSQRTIEHHLTKIFTKLGVGSRTEALLKAREYGLLSMQLVRND
ncbi:response regulator transcription factor [Sporosarcina limicola]|uniref:Two-component system competent response regulator ComA n=1 Tax=Sporosarcina limicola TaxID=34101 RepID=A0A927MI94_9BACL|nr:response regulator transcription factor [Sporosarcina limicola]MBE1555113.1 two-component system competent response regulator ComA [Sporosarcina limicola]